MYTHTHTHIHIHIHIGGPLTDKQADLYENDSDLSMHWKLKMRIWDDQAKTPNKDVPGM